MRGKGHCCQLNLWIHIKSLKTKMLSTERQYREHTQSHYKVGFLVFLSLVLHLFKKKSIETALLSKLQHLLDLAN